MKTKIGIRTFDDPALHVVCDAVQPGERLDFLDAMEWACKKYRGVGLAAPQIGVTRRVIFTLCSNRLGVVRGRFMVNPIITDRSEDMQTAEEGCLSYPGIYKPVTRHVGIRVRYETLQRIPKEETFVGYEARVIQHEADHLDGICKVGEGEVSR